VESRRTKFRKGLSTLYLPYYDALCDILPEEWQPYYGLRTFEEQNRLWAQGRQTPGKRVTNAKGGQSPHNYGCATDWTVWEDGQPLWPAASDKLWTVYEDACDKVGLRWGGTFTARDCPHNELSLSVGWNRILIEHGLYGMRGAHQLIEKMIVK
jgi:hypothetical protein